MCGPHNPQVCHPKISTCLILAQDSCCDTAAICGTVNVGGPNAEAGQKKSSVEDNAATLMGAEGNGCFVGSHREGGENPGLPHATAAREGRKTA